MIRPLRQIHRLAWPLILLASAAAIISGVRVGNATHGHQHNARIDLAGQGLTWQWRKDGDQTSLWAVAADDRRTSTGVADVYTVDANGDNPVYLESLEQLRTGMLWPASTENEYVRVFDVVHQQWLGPAIPLPAH